jgi:hypothetical protein
MQSYRLVFLDGKGRPQAYDTVFCSSDADAARQAKAIGYQNEIEIWDGGVVVRRLNCHELRPVEPPTRRSGTAA